MPELTLVPSASLTCATETAQRPNRFILFTDSWLDLQNYVQSCLQLPISTAAFETTYGAFTEQTLVTGALEAMRRLRTLGGEFGDPTVLKQRIAGDAAYLFTPAPPTELYSHIVWLAMQMQNVAGSFGHTFANLRDVLAPNAGTPQDRADNLKALLVGPGGLVSQAEAMQKQTTVLIAKLAAFEGRIGDANEQMLRYTSQQSAILQAANRLVGEYTFRIDNELKPASEAAWKSWRDFTIAAATVSVGLAIIGTLMIVLAPVTFGATGIAGMGLTAAGVVAAGALGAAAAHQRSVYNDLQTQIATAEADKQLKMRLVTDLTGLNAQITVVGRGLSDFRSNLQLIEGLWIDIGGKLAYICQNYSATQLSDLPWVTQAFKITDAQSKWRDIATTTQEFTQNSLVDYRIGRYGETIAEPAQAAA